jgi:predicted alpha/beta hydrolase family esterase
MQNILLPGFSLHNKDWAEKLVREMAKYGEKVEFLSWEHWESGNPNDFDVATESGRAQAMIKKDYNLIAKSLGTLVAAHLVVNFTQLPKKIIFFGLPLTDIAVDPAALEIYQKFFTQPSGSPLTIVQNDCDPHGNYHEVEKFVHNLNPQVPMVKTEGDDHNYPYYDLLKAVLKEKP